MRHVFSNFFSLSSTSAKRCAVTLGALILLSATAAAQVTAVRPLTEALADPGVEVALDTLEANRSSYAELLVQIGGIVSPSGPEQERAEAVAQEMRRIGLADVRVDSMPNAVGIIPGRSGRALIFVSTLDDLTTVAEHQRAASDPPEITGDRVVGPGTNTSSTTVAMLTAAKALIEAGLQPEHDLVFAAVAQEETGLTGMRALYDAYRDRAVAFIDVLGDGSRISYGALGIHWWKIHASGPGGHTLRGGLPNVNQGIGRAIDRILGLPQPETYADRRTALNIAVIESGTVFNHKPESGWFSLDVRSLDASVIEEMEAETEQILADVTEELGITFEMEPVSLVPGGQIEGIADSDLVTTSVAIARHLGLAPQLSNAGSANLNVAIAGGTPAIGLGGERGGRRGYADEWADVRAMQRSARHVLLLAATLGGAATL
ncbi:MAG: M20 family metallopeptidase [Rhodothermales bacterium]